MKNHLRNFLLFIPLLFWGMLWLNVIVGIDLMPDGFFRDDWTEYSGYGPKPTGLVSLSWFMFIALTMMILGFFINSIYTAYKKLWWWFGAYMLLGGLPIGFFWILTIIG